MCINMHIISKPLPFKQNSSTKMSDMGGLQCYAIISSHHALATAFSEVVINSFKGPGQKRAHRRQVLMTFFASIQESLSVIVFMPISDGLS